jgi:hypothetical protein
MDRWIIQGYNDDVHPEIKAFQRKDLENVAVGAVKINLKNRQLKNMI